MVYCRWKSFKLGRGGAWGLFEAVSKHDRVFFLDSCLRYKSCGLGRYSFLGFDPFLIVRPERREPFAGIKKIFSEFKIKEKPLPFPFLGGAVGYLSYDFGLKLEHSITPRKKKQLNIEDYLFAFYNSIIAVDHLANRCYIFCVGIPEKKGSLAKRLADSNLTAIQRLLSEQPIGKSCRPADKFIFSSVRKQGLSSNFTKRKYIAAIKKAKQYIRQGDIYQVNLSQMFRADTDLSAVELYRRLRYLSPSDFSAYFDTGKFQIISSSPERFLSARGGFVQTRPMKGTRRRFKDQNKDRKMRDELIASKKDKAELLMIVDLMRNDLGRVCDYDSIRVNKLRQLEEYKTVFQTTATVSGRMHGDKDNLDLLRACFPGGSITGCPKIRSMQIIDELEPGKRNIYTGAFGYISFSGDLDFSILIRTILKKGRRIYFGAGGGIVADSNPLKEHEESLIKARAMIEAIGASYPLNR